MAETLPIKGGPEGADAKVRNGWLVLLWTILTLGIYGYVWWYKVNRELADIGKARNTTELGENPTLSVLALLFGWVLLLIPTIWTLVGTVRRVQRGQALTNAGSRVNGWIYAALYIFTLGIGTYPYLQHHMNTVVRAQATLPAGQEREALPAS